MNAAEIEEAVSALAEAPFDPVEFPFAFLQAFGNKETTLRRLRKGESNRSDIGGALQTGNIHIKVAAPGDVPATLAALRASPATTRSRARFILATDGDTLEAEDLTTGETVATGFRDRRCRIDRGRPEHARGAFQELRAPLRDLVRVHVELLGQFGQRPLAPEGGQRHLRLESRAVGPARSSGHGLSSLLGIMPMTRG